MIGRALEKRKCVASGRLKVMAVPSFVGPLTLHGCHLLCCLEKTLRGLNLYGYVRCYFPRPSHFVAPDLYISLRALIFYDEDGTLACDIYCVCVVMAVNWSASKLKA